MLADNMLTGIAVRSWERLPFCSKCGRLAYLFRRKGASSSGVGAAGSAHSLFLPTEPHDRYPAAVATSPHKSSAPSLNASPVPTPYPSNPSLSLYETLTTSGPVEKPGIKVTRTQLLDLSSLEMSSLVRKSVLIVDKVEDTRTTLEYAVKELKKDIESGE